MSHGSCAEVRSNALRLMPRSNEQLRTSATPVSCIGGRVPDDLVIPGVCSLSLFDLRVNQIFQLLREGAQVFDEVLWVHVASRGARQLLSKRHAARSSDDLLRTLKKG